MIKRNQLFLMRFTAHAQVGESLYGNVHNSRKTQFLNKEAQNYRH